MNSEKILLIDVDGVACEHAKAICTWVNKEYDLSAKVDDVTTWDHDFGPVTFTQAVKYCYVQQNFITNIEVTPGFKEFLFQIATQLTVQFITTRKDFCHKSTVAWVKKHFGCDFERVLFVSKKIERNFDYLIDDSIDEVIRAADYGEKIFLFKRPWNDNQFVMSKIERKKNIYRISEFKEIYNYL